ncbi:uncharacterized protein LOC111410824 isoform X3 [Olea europaea var. sylvestris]|uniref:uncharacterized protein LOC111410824 isoform X3 n=1 Tax=Olea europaea var. sylvestris TaxID=158386 RepID=UPI000C1CE1FD|nr:uncharacterized protein LOC111410824 isoform X3 [Olea europaea var. sylvestris]
MASMASSSAHFIHCKTYNKAHKASPFVRINITNGSPKEEEEAPKQNTDQKGRREIILRSSEIAVLGAVFHFRNYNPEEGRGSEKPVSKEKAMEELLEVIKSTKPDNFSPRIVEKRDDYVRVEYESPILGFVDDVEFWFPPGKKSIVQYRSASRMGNFDFDINRKRIKVLRLELEKKGWASENTF